METEASRAGQSGLGGRKCVGKNTIGALVAALIALGIYLVSPVKHSPDSRWVLPTAQSLITDHDLGLQEWGPTIRRLGTYGLRRNKKEFLNYFPIGPALVAAPFLLVVERYPGLAPRLLGVAHNGSPEWILRHRRIIEHRIAAYVGAAAVGACFLAVSGVASTGVAALITAAVAFGSPLWSVGTRGLWQHGPALLCLFAALALLVRCEGWRADSAVRWVGGAALGAVLGLAYLMRPTGALAILCLGTFILVYRRFLLPPVVIGGGLALIPFFTTTWLRYEQILPPYYRTTTLAFTTHTFEVIAANLLSPSRGVWVMSAWTVLALLVVRRRPEPLVVTLSVWSLLHLVLVSLFDRWWAGHSYGPRFMSEAVAPLALLAALGLTTITSRAQQLGAGFLVALSIALHAPGALSSSTVRWNLRPRNVDESPERIWSIRDPQWLAPWRKRRSFSAPLRAAEN